MISNSLLTGVKYELLAFFVMILDRLFPKNPNYWGFTVHHIKAEQFIENSRAVFEAVKRNSDIKKIIFTRSGIQSFEIENACNYHIIELKSIKGFEYLLRCGVLFVTHSISMDYSLRYGTRGFSVIKLNMKKRKVINLWHGIPFKKLYALWNTDVKKRLDRVSYRNYEKRNYVGLISSSKIDSYAMSTMFFPIRYDQIWVTGLPRNDFLSMDSAELPGYLQEQVKVIKELKKGRKLILYAPTYRQTAAVKDSEYYQFNQTEIDILRRVLEEHNYIFGFRMHYFRNSENLFNMEEYIDDQLIFDLGHETCPEISPLIRESDIIISDYSSVFFDALYLNKAVISFSYDYDHYDSQQDGLLYNTDIVFPGPIVRDFNGLICSIKNEIICSEQINSTNYQIAKKIFFEFEDDKNSQRVIDKVKSVVNYQ